MPECGIGAGVWGIEQVDLMFRWFSEQVRKLLRERGRTVADSALALEESSPQQGRMAVDLSGDDTIDLHTFRPKDIPSVVQEFLDAAVAAGREHVRIIHGKGTGVQRRIVQSILQKHPSVVSYGEAKDASAWGATVARLKR